MNRELLSAELHHVDGRTILRLICDCAIVTDADVTDASDEFALTCDGCHSVRWFTRTEVTP